MEMRRDPGPTMSMTDKTNEQTAGANSRLPVSGLDTQNLGQYIFGLPFLYLSKFSDFVLQQFLLTN